MGRSRQLIGHTPKQRIDIMLRVDSKGPYECWEWQGARTRFGYGRVGYAGKAHYVHRLLYEWFFDTTIPADMAVCHSCDNPPCCNPAQLLLGTKSENTADRHRKGRTRAGRGERAGKSKLTARRVILLRRMRKLGVTVRELAAMAGVTTNTIDNVVSGKSWAHIPMNARLEDYQ